MTDTSDITNAITASNICYGMVLFALVDLWPHLNVLKGFVIKWSDGFGCLWQIFLNSDTLKENEIWKLWWKLYAHRTDNNWNWSKFCSFMIRAPITIDSMQCCVQSHCFISHLLHVVHLSAKHFSVTWHFNVYLATIASEALWRMRPLCSSLWPSLSLARCMYRWTESPVLPRLSRCNGLHHCLDHLSRLVCFKILLFCNYLFCKVDSLYLQF